MKYNQKPVVKRYGVEQYAIYIGKDMENKILGILNAVIPDKNFVHSSYKEVALFMFDIALKERILNEIRAAFSEYDFEVYTLIATMLTRAYIEEKKRKEKEDADTDEMVLAA